MSIDVIRLKNFTVFDDFKLDLSRGINVFIGENGTGKTNLLKAIYASSDISRNHNQDADILKKCFKSYGSVSLAKDVVNKTVDIFLRITSDDNEVIAVSLRIPVTRIILNDSFSDTEKRSAEQTDIKDRPESYQIHIPQDTHFNATFIPSKDMLTHSKGLLAMSNKYREFPFDITLTEIIRKANQWTLKQTPELARSILPTLEEIMDGKIIIENEEFFILKNDGRKVNFAVEAEGFKKIGLLWQLLMNESITPNSILIWDEPETNLNPKYFPRLVECLLKLSRNNIQIFLGTHNYIFVKYFDVLRQKDDHIKYHALYFDINKSGVQCESRDYFEALQHNDISKSFNELLERVYNLKISR